MIKKIPFPFHQVKEGETLKTISEKYSVPTTKILLDNHISPKQIKAGTFLIIKP